MKRILLKLSGEALAGEEKQGFHEPTVRKVALQIKQLVEEGVIDGKVSTMVAQALSGAGAAENGPSLNSEVLVLLKDYIQEVGYLQMTPEEAAAEFRSELEALLETIKP